MQKFILSFFALTTAVCFAQKTTRIDSYVFPNVSSQEKIIRVTMPFGKADIIDISGDTSHLSEAGEIFLEVICTDYPATQSLNELNHRRVNAFLRRFPFIKRNQIAEIAFFRQMNGAEKDSAEKMFHGLVVKMRSSQSSTEMKRDLALFDSLVTIIDADTAQVSIISYQDEKDSILKKLNLKNAKITRRGMVKYADKPYDMCVTGYVGYRHYPDDSSINISPKEALRKKLITKAAYRAYDWTSSVTLFFRRIDNAATTSPKKPLNAALTVKPTLVMQLVIPPDSTLLKIFARNEWRNFALAGDVTVSMYQYSAQILQWLKKQRIENFTGSFTFFNDGNEMPDNEKRIGNTGGIYTKTCQSFDQVEKLIKEAMTKGSGGDRPENYIEALLQTEESFPEKDFIVLIADNKAPVKDISLLSKLIKPVKVLLCGATLYDINTDYLNLAFKTKGSLHLVNEDFDRLILIEEGGSIKIGRRLFKLENGNFIAADAASE